MANPPGTYFAIGSTLASMVNIEANLLTTDTIHVVNGARVSYVGGQDKRAVDGFLTRDGFKIGRWMIGIQDVDNLFAFFYTEYGDHVTNSKRLYISTLNESGHYTPYYAYVERPSTSDGTLPISEAGFWGKNVVIALTDCQLQYANKTSNYSVTTSDRLLYCNTASGSMTLALAAAAGFTPYTVYSAVKTSASNSLIIDPNGSETIDGAATRTVTALNARVDYFTDGANWFTIS